MTSDQRVVDIVVSLESAAAHIEAELQVINADLQHTATNLERYGEIFLAPFRYMSQLREAKKLRYREIIGQLETLKTQIDSSAQLLQVLNAQPNEHFSSINIFRRN